MTSFIRRHLFAAVLTACLLSVVAVSVTTGLIVRARTLETELRSCHRLNLVRAEDNRNQFFDFEFDRTESALIVASLKHKTGQIPRTRAQMRATALFIRKLTDATNGKAWIPLTPCHRAVYGTFRAPEARSFATHPAPPSAFTVARGE